VRASAGGERFRRIPGGCQVSAGRATLLREAALKRLKELPDYELDKLSDDELIRYAVEARDAGNFAAAKQALTFLVWRRWDDMRRITRMKVPEHEVDGIVSEAFEDAVMKEFKGETAGEFFKRLKIILHAKTVDYYRKRTRRDEHEGPLPDGSDDENGVWGREPTSPDEFSGIEVQELIEQALSELSDKHRQVVEHYGLDDYSAEETAEKVDNMSIDNVHKIWSRFRKRLDELLGEDDNSP
jgi:RNA polymerase sigma factor (sigma-70 family)